MSWFKIMDGKSYLITNIHLKIICPRLKKNNCKKSHYKYKNTKILWYQKENQINCKISNKLFLNWHSLYYIYFQYNNQEREISIISYIASEFQKLHTL